jgi:hypothetical protein
MRKSELKGKIEEYLKKAEEALDVSDRYFYQRQAELYIYLLFIREFSEKRMSFHG